MPKVWILGGATATGKTSVAHAIARRTGATIISADAMLVYREMDIGTAKPSPQERREVPYFGLDCVSPAEPFSVKAWLDAIKPAFSQATTANQPGEGFIVTGGTGLYLKALLCGLDDLPDVSTALRETLNALTCDALVQRLHAHPAGRNFPVDDKPNKRRLVRALEILESGGMLPGERWLAPPPTIAALRHPRPVLHERIAQRVATMYTQGLLDEARTLSAKYPAWSTTAEKAIGYGEALALLRGDLTQAEAQERTIIRTRQLARRQETWLNHQLAVDWITPQPDASLDSLVTDVLAYWREHGATSITLD